MSGALQIVGMSGRSAATLTPKGTVKLRLGSVAWVEALEVLNTWQGVVNYETPADGLLDPATIHWWRRLALLMSLIGQDGQLETDAARTSVGSIPTEVVIRLTKLEAVTLLELWWALPCDPGQYGVWTQALNELHQLLS